MTTKTSKVTRPLAVHVMAKPSGAICNISCEYCFYLEKEKLYPSVSKSQWKMSDEVLERYVKQYIETQDVSDVNFAWQGGEPTLLGIGFYKKALALQKKYSNGKNITNAFQTNAILIDDEWAEFLATEKFLVGVSIDGPKNLHDRYRLDRGGNPTFDKVMSGVDAIKRYGVEFNTLTVLHKNNSDYPEEIYNFLTREVGSRFLQFIPIVERTSNIVRSDQLKLVDPDQKEAQLTEWSVGSEQYGKFLAKIFDIWVRNDVGKYYIQIFDTTLASWVGQNPGLCIFAETCGDAMVIEHNGDVYSCDHFVYPKYNLGNVGQKSIREMSTSNEQRKFGQDKKDTLPKYCRECEFRFACNGGCPKQRFIDTPDGEPGLNYLCAGDKIYFGHTAPFMKFKASELNSGRPPSNVTARANRKSFSKGNIYAGTGRNQSCPCGSQKKYKICHGA